MTEIVKTLDKITGNLLPKTYQALKHQPEVMDEIIKKWTEEPKVEWPAELGCEHDKHNSEFASFVVEELETRYHYLSFFIVVTGYNRYVVNKKIVTRGPGRIPHPSSWCVRDNSTLGSYFVYTKPHSDSYHKKKFDNNETLLKLAKASDTTVETLLLKDKVVLGKPLTSSDQKNINKMLDLNITDLNDYLPDFKKIDLTDAGRTYLTNLFNSDEVLAKRRSLEERLIVIATFIPKNHTANPDCFSGIKLICPKLDKNARPHEKEPQKTAGKNGIACTIPYHYNDFICGTSWASFPFDVKYCTGYPQYAMLGTCA